MLLKVKGSKLLLLRVNKLLLKVDKLLLREKVSK
jgi:hypothetical protein